ncbi:MAG: hypothetical protein ABIN83_07090, partial [Sphingomicrobium sp.]
SNERFEFKKIVLKLERRLRLDPHYAAMSVSMDGMLVKIYFKGNAAQQLANYTMDPRFSPVSVALSAGELEALQAHTLAWLRSRSIKFKQIDSDPHKSEVYIMTWEPRRLLRAARKDGIDMQHIKVGRVMRVTQAKPE